MKQRSISALGVALVGILPAIFGGPVWVVAVTLLCLIGYREFVAISRRLESDGRSYGLIVVPMFAIASLANRAELVAISVVGIAIALPLVDTVLRSDLQDALRNWGIGLAGTLYLGLPLFAAIELREMSGATSASWLEDLADFASFGWSSNARGLSWLLTVILVTWMADTFAYIIGENFGRRKLTPVISPNKTVEGFIGGTIAAAITTLISFRLFGIDDRTWLPLLLGFVLAIVALFGDLCESVIKRSAGVKDSGNFIPGHGGMLDRLDALLFTFVAGWYLALLIDGNVT